MSTHRLHYTAAVKALQRAYVEAETGDERAAAVALSEVQREIGAWLAELNVEHIEQTRRAALATVPPHEKKSILAAIARGSGLRLDSLTRAEAAKKLAGDDR